MWSTLLATTPAYFIQKKIFGTSHKDAQGKHDGRLRTLTGLCTLNAPSEILLTYDILCQVTAYARNIYWNNRVLKIYF